MNARTGLILLATFASGLTWASGVHYHYAPVIDVKPEYRTVTRPVDRQVCWEEQVYERVPGRSRSHTPTVIGAIIGGVIGNQFGGGSGKRAATVAGAALGGSIGRDAGRQSHGPDQYQAVTQERCAIQRERQQEQVLTGYRVRYQYEGRIHQTHMNEHPGDRIRLQVSVTPAP